MKQGNYRLKRHFSIVSHSPDLVELRHGVWNQVSYTLDDETRAGQLDKVIRALDGQLSASELSKKLGVPRDQIEMLLDHLIQIGCVETAASNGLDHYLDQVSATLGPQRGAAPMPILLLGDASLTGPIERYLHAALPEASLSVIGENDAARAALRPGGGSWALSGIDVAKRARELEKWRGHFLIVATEVIHPLELQLVNRICLEHDIPWMLAAIDGPFLFVGPVFVPHRRACFECFEARVTMNLRGSDEYLRYKQALAEARVKIGRHPIEPILAGITASHAALEATNYLLTGTTFTVSKVLSIHLPTMEISFNEVLRLPGCPACGASAEREDQELYFDMRTLLKG